MNRFDSLKQVHHLDTNNFNQKKENEKKRKEKIFSSQLFVIHALEDY